MRYELEIITTTNEYIIRGDTYNWRNAIKACIGAKWEASSLQWRIPVTTNIDSLFEAYDKHCDANLPKFGRCCRLAKGEYEYYMGPMYYACPKHGKLPVTKKGFGYTGD